MAGTSPSQWSHRDRTPRTCVNVSKENLREGGREGGRVGGRRETKESTHRCIGMVYHRKGGREGGREGGRKEGRACSPSVVLPEATGADPTKGKSSAGEMN